MTTLPDVPLSQFIFEEGSPFSSAERYRLQAHRLFELAGCLAHTAEEDMWANPADVNQTVTMYDAAAKMLAKANADLFMYLIIRDCAGEG